MQALVKVSHKTVYPNPISFEKGESLALGRIDTEYSGWVRTTTTDGNEGWAPVEYIEISQCKSKGTAICSYNAFELDTFVNEKLTVLTELNEWYFIENTEGKKGWVPMNTVKSNDL